MQDGKLPLKLQVAIRDCWTSDKTAVQVARAALRKVIGYPVRVEPEWLQLLSALDKVYPDRAALAAVVAGLVETWCKVFADLVEGADNADEQQRAWVEALMDNLQESVGLRLYVDVADNALHTKPGTAWSKDRSAFYLYLPADEPVPRPSDYDYLYINQLLHCFDKKKEEEEGETPAEKTEDKSRDDWADVEMDTATGTAEVVATAPAPAPEPAHSALSLPTRPAASKSAYLASVESLPRPDELFLRPPYHIIVSDYGAKKVIVQGSHGPSLNLLGEYLKRWCRINHQDSRRPAAVAVEYKQSCWAAGPMHDQVTLSSEGNNIYVFNPTVVLAFIEGVLGYDLVSTEQGVWTYRRTEAFKS